MKMIALLIGLCATGILIYALVKDSTGIQKGNLEERKLAPMQAAEEAVKVSNQNIDQTNEAIRRMELQMKEQEK